MNYNIENIESKIQIWAKSMNLSLDLKNPKTIQDKINWLKIHDSTPLKTKCADKILLHEYCKEKLGKDICIPIIKSYDSVNEIDWDELPDKFVIKCNHGSRMNIIVNGKSTLDKEAVLKKLEKWMETDYSTLHGCELHYHGIKRKIFVEEFKCEEGKKSLTDYKVWCFNGSPKFIQVINGRTTNKYANHYDLNWNYFDAKRSDLKTNPIKLDLRPKNLEKMIEYSKKLSADFILVRVDFYEINGDLYLGELTFTPNSGTMKFKDESISIKYGEMVNIENQKKTKNILIVHYNTPYLTECLIKSINKYTKGYKIYLFDNSDRLPFTYRQDNLIYLDNTKQEIINFSDFLKKFHFRFESKRGLASNFGTVKHSLTIQKCFDIINEPFILLDSDTLLKRDISPLYDESKIFVGEYRATDKKAYKRLLPFCCFINVPECKKRNVSYFNEAYIMGLNVSEESDKCDTGYYFHKSASIYPHKIIKCEDYVDHFSAASWTKRNADSWINLHKKQWMMEEKLIVTMTSWKKRIDNVPIVINDLLSQTKLPDIININLSVEEFPNKENDMPKPLMDIISKNKIVQINWIEGPNRRQWKKIIPSFVKYPDDMILCVDDDRRYPSNFIKTMYDAFIENEEKNPITLNSVYKVEGMLQHCGHGTIEKLSHYGDILSILNDKIYAKQSSDTFFTSMANRAGHPLIPVNSELNRRIKLFNEVEPLRKTSGTCNTSSHKEMLNFLENEIGLSRKFENFSSAKKENESDLKKENETECDFEKEVEAFTNTSKHIIHSSGSYNINKKRREISEKLKIFVSGL